MKMKQKNEIIEEYLYNTFLELKKLCNKDKGFFINEEKYQKAREYFLNRDEDIDTIKKMIDEAKEQLLADYYKWLEQEKKAFLNQFEEIQENDKLGITLNRQMIELMMIVSSNSIDELKIISKELSIRIDFDNLTIEEIKEQMFNSYINDLTERLEFYQNPQASLSKKILNIFNNANLNFEQKETLKSIIHNGLKSNMSSNEIYTQINQSFTKEIRHNIFAALSESRDLSEPGIKELQIPEIQQLYDKLKDFHSITIDFEVKYPAICMENNELYFKKLERCLNFAKSLNKDVRLNALIFFEDCPKHLSKLEVNDNNRQIVYNELLKYVDGVTKMIAYYNNVSLQEKGYEVIKSIDIFNELITRFSYDFNGEYFNRCGYSKIGSLESGWQKFLSIEDLCQIALVARKNLPNVEFVYNEVNLEDQKKLPIFKGILDKIQQFEVRNSQLLNGKKIVDCIGTQMHLNPYVSVEYLESSLNILSQYGYPIKITEYDQPLSAEFIKTHTHQECEIEKTKKQAKLKEFIMKNARKYNIKQVTIWSLTDTTNFLLDKKNKALIYNGKKPLNSIYGGAFRDRKSFDYMTTDEKKLAFKIKEKNQKIKKRKRMNKPKVLKKLAKTDNNKGFVNIGSLHLIGSLILLFLVIILLFVLWR